MSTHSRPLQPSVPPLSLLCLYRRRCSAGCGRWCERRLRRRPHRPARRRLGAPRLSSARPPHGSRCCSSSSASRARWRGQSTAAFLRCRWGFGRGSVECGGHTVPTCKPAVSCSPPTWRVPAPHAGELGGERAQHGAGRAAGAGRRTGRRPNAVQGALARPRTTQGTGGQLPEGESGSFDSGAGPAAMCRHESSQRRQAGMPAQEGVACWAGGPRSERGSCRQHPIG